MLKALYITPVSNQLEDGYEPCTVREIIGPNAGLLYDGTYRYHSSLFQKYFHGTLTMFCEDDRHITDTKEIRDRFGIHYAYVTALNMTTGEMFASDGATYSLMDNYFSKCNNNTLIHILNDLNSCSSCYIQLVIETKTGKLLDITLITNPINAGNTRFACEKRIVKGFLPVDAKPMMATATVNKNTNSGNEKLSQEDIDKLIEVYLKG